MKGMGRQEGKGRKEGKAGRKGMTRPPDKISGSATAQFVTDFTPLCLVTLHPSLSQVCKLLLSLLTAASPRVRSSGLWNLLSTLKTPVDC